MIIMPACKGMRLSHQHIHSCTILGVSLPFWEFYAMTSSYVSLKTRNHLCMYRVEFLHLKRYKTCISHVAYGIERHTSTHFHFNFEIFLFEGGSGYLFSSASTCHCMRWARNAWNCRAVAFIWKFSSTDDEISSAFMWNKIWPLSLNIFILQ